MVQLQLELLNEQYDSLEQKQIGLELTDFHLSISFKNRSKIVWSKYSCEKVFIE